MGKAVIPLALGGCVRYHSYVLQMTCALIKILIQICLLAVAGTASICVLSQEKIKEWKAILTLGCHLWCSMTDCPIVRNMVILSLWCRTAFNWIFFVWDIVFNNEWFDVVYTHIYIIIDNRSGSRLTNTHLSFWFVVVNIYIIVCVSFRRKSCSATDHIQYIHN